MQEHLMAPRYIDPKVAEQLDWIKGPVNRAEIIKNTIDILKGDKQNECNPSEDPGHDEA